MKLATHQLFVTEAHASFTMTDYFRNAAHDQWTQARRRAVITRLTANLRGREARLIDYDEIAQRLSLRSARYIGCLPILLEKIVGSVGRYQDFTAAFLPVTREMQSRWENVALLFLDPARFPPPIEAYKVGENYFVRDGNHRVSVARQLKLADVEAHVWEYPLPVKGLPPSADIDTLLIAYERQDFLETTHLDTLRPGMPFI
ncbi:MAG: hypothetical protein HC915_12900 [Anaerolineae bacterium]|nr:hypothetical protein [Anaerolineae bacterium]